MTAVEAGRPPARGVVDAAGRLVSAEPRLAELNARAGGALGSPLAVPQLATFARLARRLSILVSRSVVVADGDDDVELWVRAEPDGDLVRLSVTGWQSRAAWLPVGGRRRAWELPAGNFDWAWQTDAALRLCGLTASGSPRFDVDVGAMLGQPITRLFALSEHADGGFPILAAVANQASFAGQRATLRGTELGVLLAAEPRIDADDRFAGFAGVVRLAVPTAVPPDHAGQLPTAFGVKLDKALRAPLGRIVANADSIHAQSDGPLRPEYAEYANDIATAGRHLLGLVDDLLDLQAVEEPGFTTIKETIDLADIARRAAGLLAVRAERGNVQIDRPAPDDRLIATGEFRRALQVLVNLIGNAVRYSPAGGTVWLRVERDGAMAAVIVADQGKGVAAADQSRIFEKFERVDLSEPGGSGLGLYISRRLARAMGGDLLIDSELGQGARFILTLPSG